MRLHTAESLEHVQLAAAEKRAIPSEIYRKNIQKRSERLATQIRTTGFKRRELVVGNGDHDELSVHCEGLHEFLEGDTLRDVRSALRKALTEGSLTVR
jgi:hypothetical protein